MAISVLGISAAFLFQGVAIGARLSNWLAQHSTNRLERIEFGGGVTTEFLAGCAGLVFGVLSLLGVVPAILAAVSALIFGTALLFGGGVTARLSRLRPSRLEESERYWRQANETVSAVTSIQMLVGVSAIVLGILSLVGTVPLTLALVATLAIGSAAMISSTAVCTRSLGYLRRP